MLTSQTILAMLMVCLAAVPSWAGGGGASVVYDFAKRFPDAVVANALMSGTKAGTATSGGVRRSAVLLHPGGSGDATATYQFELPAVRAGERLVMTFGAGMSDGFEKNDAAHPSDGVRFVLRVDGRDEFERELTDVGWADGALDLTDKAGKRIEVVFATNPRTNSNYDWASCWHDYRLAVITRVLFMPMWFWVGGDQLADCYASFDRATQAFADLGCSELLS